MNQDTIWLVISIVVLAGIAVVWIRKRIKLGHARTWPTAEGRVETTHIRLERTGAQQSMHLAEVTYSYAAQGAAYSGNLRRRFLLHGAANKWTDTYTAGRPLIIRYNPHNASDSVLFEQEQSAGAQLSSKITIGP